MTMGRPLALALVAACWVLPASGQYNLPTPNAAVPPSRPLSEVDQSREMLNQYGYCVMIQNFGSTRRALALPDDAAVERALMKLTTNDCLFAGQLKMSPALLRGAVYRAMYIHDFSYLSQTMRAAVTPASGQPGEEVDAAPSTMFGGCVAKLAPTATRDFVMASAATPEENKALAGLASALADCLPPKQEMRLSRWGLQATLAEAVYKRTVAQIDKTKALGAK
ncbi:hypothetical protein FPZ24_06655 [Sphingomonas panacisoli]|uniref:Uncharacterized protein n=1 Tax=Sphingomonas panacisoli TaxID=1813879 RepID=A0A5B8LG14_9SPHN|nr:hypothetical protein [Sphingomonas panacisoli]QDZ07198.1 hypothetical protein FPZ24_06655 [Sphingomonas panacisoli]